MGLYGLIACLSLFVKIQAGGLQSFGLPVILSRIRAGSWAFGFFRASFINNHHKKHGRGLSFPFPCLSLLSFFMGLFFGGFGRCCHGFHRVGRACSVCLYFPSTAAIMPRFPVCQTLCHCVRFSLLHTVHDSGGVGVVNHKQRHNHNARKDSRKDSQGVADSLPLCFFF